MRVVVMFVAAIGVAFAIGRLTAQEIKPSCVGCKATYIPASELAAYEAASRANNVIDQQVRSVDVGKTKVQIALVHRGKLDAPAARSVAEHDLVTEVYYV